MDEREVERIFGVLGPVLADRSIVLVGGQAVFVWAQRLGLVEAAGADTGWLATEPRSRPQLRGGGVRSSLTSSATH
jgi:hypothetical protein